MENKKEHIICKDIPSGGKFHSAVLTTYSIDLLHFDSYLRNVLRRKQICCINLLVDDNQINRSLEFVNPLYMHSLGRDYSVTNMPSKGAFHPKINFFVGDNAALVVFGSGNLTVGGHGKNHEVFSGFMTDKTDESQLPLIKECWQYLSNFAHEGGDFIKQRITHDIPSNCIYLKTDDIITRHKLYKINDDTQAALLYNEDTSGILSQISKIIPSAEIEKITIVSPFFDEDGETLNTLSKLCPNATLNVLIQADCTLPPNKIIGNKKILFFDFDKTTRGKMVLKNNVQRLAHAKIFIFESPRSNYCVIGSANATKAGLGTLNNRGINDEFCVLYKSREDYVKTLGLKAVKKYVINPQELESENRNSGKQNKSTIKILSASYQGECLTINLDSAAIMPKEAVVYLDNGETVNFIDEYTINDGKISLSFNIKKDVYICGITDKSHIVISNKVFVNNVDILEYSNPSKTSRALNSFVSRIENSGYGDLEITGILTEVFSEYINGLENIELRPKLKGNNKEKEVNLTLPEIHYNPDVDNNTKDLTQYLKIDNSSRLVDCIEDSFKRTILFMDNELKDEEEEGKAEESNKRQDCKRAEDKQVSKSNIITVNDAYSVLDEYRYLIYRRKAFFDKLKIKGLTKDDFNFFSLSMFAVVEICYLNRCNWNFEEYDIQESSRLIKKYEDILNPCLEGNGMKALHEFTLFCKEYYNPYIVDNDYLMKAHRSIKYALLFAISIIRGSNRAKCFEKQLYGDIKVLLGLFGEPDIQLLKTEFEPIIEKYKHIFEFRYVEKIIGNIKKSN